MNKTTYKFLLHTLAKIALASIVSLLTASSIIFGYIIISFIMFELRTPSPDFWIWFRVLLVIGFSFGLMFEIDETKNNNQTE